MTYRRSLDTSDTVDLFVVAIKRNGSVILAIKENLSR